jgi:hypothetical protein
VRKPPEDSAPSKRQPETSESQNFLNDDSPRPHISGGDRQIPQPVSTGEKKPGTSGGVKVEVISPPRADANSEKGEARFSLVKMVPLLVAATAGVGAGAGAVVAASYFRMRKRRLAHPEIAQADMPLLEPAEFFV